MGVHVTVTTRKPDTAEVDFLVASAIDRLKEFGCVEMINRKCNEHTIVSCYGIVGAEVK